MFDSKVVRRRRAALAILVALSLVMLTAYFGESGGGVFHSLSKGTQTALSPLEKGAGKALKPVSDLFGWVGDTFHAKSQNGKLKDEVSSLRQQLGTAVTAQRDAKELRGLMGLQHDAGFPSDTKPVSARVILRSPTVWYSTVRVDRGSNDGVRVNQPVIADGGLAGKITAVSGGSSQVTLITDGSSAVSGQIMPEGTTGIVKPEVGNPDDLLLDFVQKNKRVSQGATIVTSGFKSSKVESLFPRGIPIGKVTRVDLGEVDLYQRVHIKPFADLRRIDYVQVLTSRGRQSQQVSQVTP